MKLRRAMQTDAEAVSTLWRAREDADVGYARHTVEDLVDAWQLSDFELAADAIVAHRSGEIVGYAEVRDEGSIALVAPAHEAEGIGTRLLDVDGEPRADARPTGPSAAPRKPQRRWTPVSDRPRLHTGAQLLDDGAVAGGCCGAGSAA